MDEKKEGKRENGTYGIIECYSISLLFAVHKDHLPVPLDPKPRGPSDLSLFYNIE